MVVQAVGLFAVTNIDDLVVLTLFFGRTHRRSDAQRVVLGQYLGLAAILAVSVAAALGARLLPESVIPYLGLLPLLLGLREGWEVRQERRKDAGADDDEAAPADSDVRVDGGDDDVRELRPGAGALTVAAVTFANGGDNIAVYVPVFAVAGVAALVGYVAVFLVLVAVWCAAAYRLSRHRRVAPLLSRWGHVLLPLVLVGLGVAILVEGGAFGL